LFFPKKSIELSRKHSDFGCTFLGGFGCAQPLNYRALSAAKTPNDKKNHEVF
jgi:hypothetical protein